MRLARAQTAASIAPGELARRCHSRRFHPAAAATRRLGEGHRHGIFGLPRRPTYLSSAHLIGRAGAPSVGDQIERAGREEASAATAAWRTPGACHSLTPLITQPRMTLRQLPSSRIRPRVARPAPTAAGQARRVSVYFSPLSCMRCGRSVDGGTGRDLAGAVLAKQQTPVAAFEKRADQWRTSEWRCVHQAAGGPDPSSRNGRDVPPPSRGSSSPAHPSRCDDTGGTTGLRHRKPSVAKPLDVQRNRFTHEALHLFVRVADDGNTGHVRGVRSPRGIALLVDDEVLGHRRSSSPVL